VDAGASLTLSWESVNADTAQLEQLDANQAVVQTFSVTPNGQLPVTVPSTAGDVIYRLTVFRAGRMDTRSVVVTVQATLVLQRAGGGRVCLQHGNDVCRQIPVFPERPHVQRLYQR
jgi:hypothetical protein